MEANAPSDGQRWWGPVQAILPDGPHLQYSKVPSSIPWTSGSPGKGQQLSPVRLQYLINFQFHSRPARERDLLQQKDGWLEDQSVTNAHAAGGYT